ncbi:zinc finger CCHC-type and RNA-binding motif-containing protein 1-like [Liolophura sinensis]|uniref:zinc finger CCHC-type and RNA-binding motif-containing protein 1-like n=1 Tax=Liolophura sinensis TaxID=3198878 RepID=UPI003157FF57
MSGGLAPSKSTIYVSNLPFSLTNNDLHKVFIKYGQVVKVTIVKDKVTRKSKGVAFILFLTRDAAHQSVRALNNTQMFGRTIKCSIAKDNGRASDFIRRKNYPDKSRCYECGEEGHLSYKCPHNLLGDREIPKKKERKRKGKTEEDNSEEEKDSGEEVITESDSLSAAISYQYEKMGQENPAFLAGASLSDFEDPEPKRKKYKKDAYFSDEEELDD